MTACNKIPTLCCPLRLFSNGSPTHTNRFTTPSLVRGRMSSFFLLSGRLFHQCELWHNKLEATQQYCTERDRMDLASSPILEYLAGLNVFLNSGSTVQTLKSEKFPNFQSFGSRRGMHAHNILSSSLFCWGRLYRRVHRTGLWYGVCWTGQRRRPDCLEMNSGAMSVDVSSYVKLQKELLVLEREAEKEETTLASEGAKLSILQSSGVSTCLC